MTGDAAEVAAALASKPVTRLIHFTPAMNLFGILRDGMIRPASDLQEDSDVHHTVTDEMRYDGYPGHVCCSFEFPNNYYLAKARAKPGFVNYPNWVCLALDPNLVLRSGTLFYPCNAAKSHGMWAGEGAEALLGMWSNPSKVGGHSRRTTHHPAVPTDLQAEIQIPGSIPLSAVTAIIAPTAQRCRELFGTLHPHGLHPEQIQWGFAPTYFDAPYHLRNAIHTSAPINETIWTPSAEDLE